MEGWRAEAQPTGATRNGNGSRFIFLATPSAYRSQSNCTLRHDTPASIQPCSAQLQQRSYGSPVRHDLVGRIAEEDVAPVRAPLRDAQGKALGALVEVDPGHAQGLAVLAWPHVH